MKDESTETEAGRESAETLQDAAAAQKSKKKAAKKVDKKKDTKPLFGRDPNQPTKKSIVIKMLSLKKGATIEQMAQACTEAGLGDIKTNLSTVKLWLPKIGFKVKKDGDLYRKA